MDSYLQWLNPLWIAALPLAVLTPLLAHLLARRGGRLAIFPTVRFLQQAMADESRWRRPVDWLLLILRMLIVAMVILAFARPMLVKDLPVHSASSGLALVLIVDASASMQRTEQGISLFDRARQQAITTLQSLDPSKDRALVVVLDASPRPLLPMMSGHFSQLVDRLQGLSPTWQAGDLTVALSLAVRPPMHADDPINLTDLEIHLYSDMQKTQWPDDAALATLLRNRRLVLHATGSGQDNLALRRPAAQPTVPIVGQLAQATVEVVNHSDRPVQTRVSLAVGQSSSPHMKLQPQGVTLEPRSVKQAQFSWQVKSEGLHHLQFTLEGAGGALDIDDQTGLFVETSQARRVALVTQGSIHDADDAAYYMHRALMPARDEQGNDVHVEVWPPEELIQRLASRPPAALVMIQAGAMDPAWLTHLHFYLQQGGGMWWIIDSPLAAQSLLSWRDEQDLPVSPIVSTAAASAWQPGVERGLSRGRFDDPILRIFQGSVRSALLSPRLSQSMVGTLADDAHGLLDFHDDRPALATRWIGQGRLAVLAGSLSPRRSDWVKQPVFVPLVHQLIRGLSPGPQPGANPWAGAGLHFHVPVSPLQVPLVVLHPDGTISPVTTAYPRGDAWEIGLGAAQVPGPYRVMQEQDSGRTLLAGVQVDVSDLESDLTPRQPTKVGQAGQGHASTDGAVTFSDSPFVREQAEELWPWLLVGTAGLLILESLLAGWGYRRLRIWAGSGGGR